MSHAPNIFPTRPQGGVTTTGRKDDGSGAAGDESAYGFWDIVDVVNPLQHIPLISTGYRELTGDTLRPAARIFGGALFAGPIGLIGGVANSIVEQASGRDVGGNLLAALSGEDAGDTTTTVLAARPSTPEPEPSTGTVRRTETTTILAALAPTGLGTLSPQTALALQEMAQTDPNLA